MKLYTMIARCLLVGVAAAVLGVWPLANAPALADEREPAADEPFLFVENVGQFDAGARFQMWGGPGTVWLAEDGLWITVAEPQALTPASSLLDGEGDTTQEGEGEPHGGVNLHLTFPGRIRRHTSSRMARSILPYPTSSE